jgi:pilus assembly protein CpaE
MRVSVISDREALGTKIREALVAAGQDCPSGHVFRIDEAESLLVRSRPELVVAVTGRDADTAIHTISRLRDLVPGRVLAVGPVSEPKLVLRVLRGGADDYVDEDEIETEIASALTRLSAGRTERIAPGRVIAVLGVSGGSGASLIAANLAVAMAKTHEKSLLVDLRSRCGDLAAMLDLKPSHTIEDLCRNSSRIDRVLMEQTLLKHATGVNLLASPSRYGAVLEADSVTTVFDLGRGMFARTITDIDAALPEESLVTLRTADVILLVMRMEFNSLRNAKSMLEHLERQRVDPKQIVLVGNRVGQPKEIPAVKIEEALSRKFFAKLPDDPKAALGSQNNGVPVLKEWPSSRLSKGLVALATALDAIPAQSS